MYNSAMTKVFAAINQLPATTIKRSHTKVREHAPEDSQRRGGLLVQTPERSPLKPLQVIKGGEG